MKSDTALNSWSDFVEEIASLFDSGLSEQKISEKFNGKNIQWIGKVSKIKLDEEYAPGIGFNMSPTHLPLKKNRVLRSDYLFLNIAADFKEQWSSCDVNDVVQFSAVIESSNKLFPEIELSVSEDDPEVLLMVGLYKCKFIKKI